MEAKTSSSVSLIARASISERVWIIALFIAALGLRIVVLTVMTNSITVDVSFRNNKDERVSLVSAALMENDFSTTIHNLRASGALATMVLLLIGTAIVPMVRLALAGVVIVYPFSERHVGLRNWILHFLDHLGRFILADHFLAAYSSNFFYMRKEGLESVPRLLPHDVEIVLSNDYEYYMYGYLGSNILGSILTHKLLGLVHDQIILQDVEVAPPQTLFRRIYATKRAGEKAVLAAALLAAVVSITDLLLAHAHIVTFTLGGVAGSVSGAEPKKYDMWTPVVSFAHSARVSGNTLRDTLPWVLSIAYLLTVIVVPLVLVSGAVLVLFVVPLRRQMHADILASFPFWFSWCALDVFFAVTLSLYFEMDVLASYVFSNKYPHICEALEHVFKDDCTSVYTAYGHGIFSLAILVIALYVLRAVFARGLDELEHESRQGAGELTARLI